MTDKPTQNEPALAALEELRGFIFSDGAGVVCAWVNKYRKEIEQGLEALTAAQSAPMVDVEALKKLVCKDALGRTQSIPNDVDTVIDHLAASGYLKTPSVLIEKPDRECIMFLLSLGFTHKIENGFHVVEGHGFKYSHIGILNIAHRIKQTFFEKSSPPPVADLAALERAIADFPKARQRENGVSYNDYDVNSGWFIKHKETIRALLDNAIAAQKGK